MIHANQESTTNCFGFGEGGPVGRARLWKKCRFNTYIKKNKNKKNTIKVSQKEQAKKQLVR